MDKENIKKVLNKEIPENQIFMDEPMNKHTSFKIGGKADIFVQVKNIRQLKYVIKIAKKENVHLTILGNGSNVLVKDKGIRGIVLKIEFEEIEIQTAMFDKAKLGNILSTDIREEKTEFPKLENVIVTVGSGVKLGELAGNLLKEEISGFEFAAGIPGTIGGAVKMNAGAYRWRNERYYHGNEMLRFRML